MLTYILGLIPGLFTTVNGITNAISNEKIALINAKTDQERIASQERINTLEAKRDVLISDSKHSGIDSYLRAFLTIPPGFYTGKIFLWDKALGLGSTDPVTTEQWAIVGVVYGFFFLYSGLRLFR